MSSWLGPLEPRPESAEGNPINGRDYVTVQPPSGAPDDLQYACILPLPVPRDCNQFDPNTCCDCRGAPDTPLCEQVPGESAPGTTQYWAKAYAGLRQL